MIEQIINPNEIVQTQMSVEVDGIRVDYCDEPYNFTYHFYTSHETLENSRDAVDKVVEALMYQSYDHGSEWRIVGTKENFAKFERYEQYEKIVRFRIKDSY